MQGSEKDRSTCKEGICMKVYYDRENKEYTVKAKNIQDMLKELKINKNSVIVVVNGMVVTEEYDLKTKDKIKILSVVSGG